MFNIFFFADNACLSNYADDTTLYSTGEDHNSYINLSN